MTGTHLSPAMRTMLRNAIQGVDLYFGMGKAAHQAGGGTRNALVSRGLLDSNNQPTAAGRAMFAPFLDLPTAATPHAHSQGAPC